MRYVFVLREQGGELVGVLRGANAPLLQRMIVQKLNEEKTVLEKGGERKVVRELNTSQITHQEVVLEQILFNSNKQSLVSLSL